MFALLLAVSVTATESEDAFPTPMPLESFMPRVKRQFIYGGYPGGYGGYGGYPYGYGGYGVGYPYGGYWG
ncbi:unnamed protein product [Auanema sp. JU1783]|nr:unnamed protein product [Auanema sp. JU1783]